MTGSARQVNYALRPAKFVERSMLVEVARRLGRERNVAGYQYVGLGAAHLIDFALMHRELGISNMTSIEMDGETAVRAKLNRPFAAIRILEGVTKDVLPSMRWNGPRIVWLDFDGPLDLEILGDVTFLATKLAPMSLVFTSVSCNPEKREGRVDRWKASLGEKLVPPELNDAALGGWGTADFVRDRIDARIAEDIHDRNQGLEESDQLAYKQLLYLRYRDTQEMCAVGGLIYPVSEVGAVAACQFEGLPFVRTGRDAFDITVPPLSLREILALESKLPLASGKQIKIPGLSKQVIEQFVRVYRHLPGFVRLA